MPFFLQDVDPTLITGIERLGGWGVVVFVVLWLTRRMERVLSEQTKGIADLAEAMNRQLVEIRHTQDATIEQMGRNQQRGEERTMKICKLLEKLTEKLAS